MLNRAEQEWPSYIPQQSIRWLMGRVHVGTPDTEIEADIRKRLAKNNASEEANAHLIAAAPEMAEALADVSLRCTQAKLAHDIGSKTKQQQIDFLLGELQRIASVADAALKKAGLL